MPKRLLARWREESIREFRASAHQRFNDGLALAAAGRRTGAIYLWGYCAEMILKAGYFTLIGLGEADVITIRGHIDPAIEKGGRLFGINWPRAERGHNVRAWTELLIAERVSLAVPYQPPFAAMVQRCGQQIGQLWSVPLRYHENVAYVHEVSRVREAVEWFLVNADRL